jgi:hypothetical protein
MNSIGILFCLLSGVGSASEPSDAPPGTATLASQRTIEILIAGPEDARNRMEATLRPLLGEDPDLRWATQERVPTNGALPGSREQDPAQLWIDVSSPVQLRMYLPTAGQRGTTTVRTLSRRAAEGENADLLAHEGAAQIMKAAVLALRGEPADSAEETPSQVAKRRRAHTRHESYVRVHAGLGLLNASESHEGMKESYSKLGPTFNAAVGGALLPDLILYGEFLMTAVANADWTSNGRYQPGRGLDAVMFGFGPGIAYYFASINMYLSGTLAFAKVVFPTKYTDYPIDDTDMGLAGSFTLGKEWWIASDWGLGVAGQFNFGSMKHHTLVSTSYGYDPYDTRMYLTTFSLLISATYN